MENTWIFEHEELFQDLGFRGNDLRQLKPYKENLIQALLFLYSDSTVDSANSLSELGTSAPLLFPGAKYHISLKGIAKDTLLSSTQAVAKLLLLHQYSLIDLSMAISSSAIAATVSNFSRLDDHQRTIIQAILDIKSEKKVHDYCPTTAEIADKTGQSESEIFQEAISMKALKRSGDCWQIVL